jgi:hypothetical protein
MGWAQRRGSASLRAVAGIIRGDAAAQRVELQSDGIAEPDRITRMVVVGIEADWLF